MNEMEMLRAYHKARPDPDARIVAQSRTRLGKHTRTASGRRSSSGPGVVRSLPGLAWIARSEHLRSPTGLPRLPGTSRRPRRYALAAAGVLAAATAAVVAPAAIDSERAPQAYAVERQPDGTLKVTLRQFTDAEGLERRLRSYGVNADIEFLRKTQRCTNHRGKIIPSGQRVVEHPWMFRNPPRTPLAKLPFRVFPERMKPGQTLVWEMSYDPENLDGSKGTFSLGEAIFLVEGRAKPCAPRDLSHRRPLAPPR